jgi:5'-3' exonuclease
MGVRDFTKVFEPSEKDVTFAKLPPKEDYAVDAFLEMFRSTAMQGAAKLTNPKGEPTLHLTVCIANACSRKARGHEDIWCFDSRDPRVTGDAKAKTLLTREEIRKKNLAEIKRQEAEITKLEQLAKTVDRKELLALDPTFDITLQSKREELGIMRARNPDKHHFNTMIRDVLFILEKLGIQYALAPVGVDAEKLGAQLCREGWVEGVITTDTDSLVYGAPKQIKKISGKSGKYDIYVLKDILKKHDLTMRQLAEVASVLGCDFCEKTAGVGAGTVIRKVKAGMIKYTDEQLAAQRKFLDRTPVDYGKVIQPDCTKKSLDELKEWLVRVQGFGAIGVDKKLAPFYTALEKAKK